MLNLILYSPNPAYDEMRSILSLYLTTKKVEHYFYWYDPDLSEEHAFEGNTLRLRGQESLMPGVLNKTLEALELTLDKKYDFIVRSNVSTVIDFDELSRHLTVGSVDYGGALYYSQTSVVPEHGMTPEKFAIYGKHSFVLGTHIVLSRKAVQMILDNKEIIQGYGFIDDVALGVFFHDRSDVIKGAVGVNSYSFVNDEFVPSRIMYRNKSGDRSRDVKNMSMIVRKLLSQRTGCVPKLIHQIWIGPREPPRAYLDTWSKDYIAANPHYAYKLWRDAELENLMLSNAPLYEIFSAEKEMCGKADIARYYILYLFGGIYVDADSVWINERSLDPIVDTSGDLFMAMEPGKSFVASGVIGCVQYSLKILQIVNRMTRMAPSYRELRKTLACWQITGPLLLNLLNPLNRDCYYICLTAKRAYYTQDLCYDTAIIEAASTSNDCMIVKIGGGSKQIVFSLPSAGKQSRLYAFLQSLYENTTVLPSYHFYPVHWSGITDPKLHTKIPIDNRSCMFQYGITTNALKY